MQYGEDELNNEKPLVESDKGEGDDLDPEASPPKSRKLFTQPYELSIKTLSDQIKSGTLHLRPVSGKPYFQRRYVWPDKLASKLIESILLNVPIPPCYFAQDADFELEVIDGQQRIFSIYRFLENQFKLSSLESITEINGKHFFELDPKIRNKIHNHTLRCIVITNDSDEELRFDVFERLNSNTIPLNAQELRNCIYRGSLIGLVGDLASYKPWLKILRRQNSDKRMRDEELILRFFAFQKMGLNSYRTPQKYWLNDIAKWGKKLNDDDVVDLKELWEGAVNRALKIFKPDECFRRNASSGRASPVNKALMDLHMYTLSKISDDIAEQNKEEYRNRVDRLLGETEFDDLISRSIDHRSRTLRRFEIWNDRIESLFS